MLFIRMQIKGAIDFQHVKFLWRLLRKWPASYWSCVSNICFLVVRDFTGQCENGSKVNTSTNSCSNDTQTRKLLLWSVLWWYDSAMSMSSILAFLMSHAVMRQPSIGHTIQIRRKIRKFFIHSWKLSFLCLQHSDAYEWKSMERKV